MVSGVDIVTYVGIPLAVLGVVPLLWNFTLSILILRRARNAIPPSAQTYFHFRIDPVNGKVNGSFSRPRIEYPELLRSSASRYLPKSHHLQVAQPQGVAGRWVALMGLHVKLSPVPEEYETPFQLVYNASATFLPLECDWITFVLLAFGFGVDPRDQKLHEVRNSISSPALKDVKLQLQAELLSDGETYYTNKLYRSTSEKVQRTVMTITFHEDTPVVALSGQQLEFDLRRMLGWYSIMVVKRGLSWYCIPSYAPYEATKDKLPDPSYLTSEVPMRNDAEELAHVLRWLLYCDTEAERGSPINAAMINIYRAKKLAMSDLNEHLRNSGAEVLEELGLNESSKEAMAELVADQMPQQSDRFSALYNGMKRTPAFETLRATYGPSALIAPDRNSVTLSDASSAVGFCARVFVILCSSSCVGKRYWQLLLESGSWPDYDVRLRWAEDALHDERNRCPGKVWLS